MMRPRDLRGARFHAQRQQLDGHAQARHRIHQRLLDAHRARPRRAPASSRRARACAGRQSGAGRHGASTMSSKRSCAPSGTLAAKCSSVACSSACDLGVERLVHQPLRRAPHQLHAFARDVQRHADREQRIEPEPAGEVHRDDADHDRGRGPDIGHQVPRIGLQRDRAVHARRAKQRESQCGVEARTERSTAPGPSPAGPAAAGESSRTHRRPEDGEGRADDQDAFEAARRSTRPCDGRRDGLRRPAARRS